MYFMSLPRKLMRRRLEHIAEHEYEMVAPKLKKRTGDRPTKLDEVHRLTSGGRDCASAPLSQF
jgi:hypothetical protein